MLRDIIVRHRFLKYNPHLEDDLNKGNSIPGIQLEGLVEGSNNFSKTLQAAFQKVPLDFDMLMEKLDYNDDINEYKVQLNDEDFQKIETSINEFLGREDRNFSYFFNEIRRRYIK